MPQTLLCVVGVVVYVATLCVTLTYGYLALGRVYESEMTSHRDRDRPVGAASAGPAEAFAEASSTARFRSVGVGLIHLGDPYQDLLVPAPLTPDEAPGEPADVVTRTGAEPAWRPRLLNPRTC